MRFNSLYVVTMVGFTLINLIVALPSIPLTLGKFRINPVSIMDELDPLDGLDTMALFSDVPIVMDAGLVDVKALDVELEVDEKRGDVQITLNLTMANDLPHNLTFNLLVYIDSDLNPTTGFNEKPGMLNGLGAEWNLGFIVEEGEITFTTLEVYNQVEESFQKAGDIEGAMGPNWLTTIFSWRDIERPEAIQFMTYIITMNVTDMIPNFGQDLPILRFEFPPVAEFEVPPNVDEGSQVILDASGSVAFGTEIVSYSWDFNGDGVVDLTSEDPSVTAKFLEDGEAKIILTILTLSGLTDGSIKTIDIINVAPSEIEIIREGSLVKGEESTFFGDAVDPGSDDLIFTWDFGDGTTADGRETIHSWETVGEFTVVLTVNDGDGGIGTAEMVLNVVEVPPPPLSERISLDAFIPVESEDPKGEFKFDIWFSYDDAGTGEPAIGMLMFYVDDPEGGESPFYQTEISLAQGTTTFGTPWWGFEPGLHTGTVVVELEEGEAVLSSSVEYEVNREGLDLLPFLVAFLGIAGIFAFLTWMRSRRSWASDIKKGRVQIE